MLHVGEAAGAAAADVANLEGEELVLEEKEVLDEEEVGVGGAVFGGFDACFGAEERDDGFLDDFEDDGAVALLGGLLGDGWVWGWVGDLRIALWALPGQT